MTFVSYKSAPNKLDSIYYACFVCVQTLYVQLIALLYNIDLHFMLQLKAQQVLKATNNNEIAT